MTKAANENNDPWQPLSLATDRLLLKLDEKRDEKSEGQPDADNTDEEKRKAHREYVEHGLRKLSAFERRARGLRKDRA